MPAGFAIAAVIVGCFLLGQAVEDALNPRLRVSYLSIAPVAAAAAGGPGAGRHMSLLEVSGLHVWFEPPHAAEVHAVQGVSFALDAGERFGLVGESGCGKTTTVLALMGLLPPNASAAGEVLIDGQDILAGGEDSVQAYRWKDIAMVFQGAMNALNPVKKVGWQIAEPMAFHGVAQGAAARQRAGELLEMVGIPAAAGDRYPHEFSGGMRQRAAIAMALACEPKILLADEPTTALDVMVQAQILELLTGLCPRPRPGPDPGHPRPAGCRPGMRAGRGDVRGRDRRRPAAPRRSTTSPGTPTPGCSSRPPPTSTAGTR